MIQDEKVEKFRQNQIIKDIAEEKTEITNSNLSSVNESIHYIKPTILSKVKIERPLTQNKPLGVVGDITLNELLNKGLDIFNSPIVQMIKDKVDVQFVGLGISSMIMYRAIVKLFMKTAYSQGIPNHLLPGPSTRTREIALFRLFGAPAADGAFTIINSVTAGGSKVILNIAGNNELEGTGSTISNTSNSSLFLFINKLPNWIKIILRYLALASCAFAK
jgi:hypothetical protein